MSFENITVVITTFKSEKKILNCLESIDKNCQVIVIENSNNHLLKIELEKKFTNLKCFVSKENLGYAKGNNFGLSKVQTKYALILNPDTELTKNALKNFFKTTNKLKDFAIIGPKDKDIQNQEISNNLLEVKYVKGFAMFLKMDHFKNIGFFDESFFIYLEEIDLCDRVRSLGKKIYLDSSIDIIHQGGSSHDEEYDFEMELSRNWHWMWSFYYYNKKYHGVYTAGLRVFNKFFSALIKYIFYSIIFKKNKKLIYKQRLSGLLNSIFGRPSFYRPFQSN